MNFHHENTKKKRITKLNQGQNQTISFKKLYYYK